MNTESKNQLSPLIAERLRFLLRRGSKLFGLFASLVAAFLISEQCCVAQQQQSTSTASTAAAVASSIPAYPDSPNGLEKLMKDLLKLQKKGNTQALLPYVQSLVLPDAATWFQSVFGEQIGSSLAGSYERTGMELPLSFPDTLADLLRQKVGDPYAVEFSDSCNPRATPREYPILILRQNSQHLYDIRFFKGSSFLTLAYFAYVGGGFRYLGNFEVSGAWPIGTQPTGPKGNGTAPTRVRLGGNVMAARIIYEPKPEYPAEARQARLQGTVLIHAVIGKDGSLEDLQLLQGQCWLAQAAIKSVRQWRYTPYLLNGQPVEVDTTIQAIFNMQ